MWHDANKMAIMVVNTYLTVCIDVQWPRAYNFCAQLLSVLAICEQVKASTSLCAAIAASASFVIVHMIYLHGLRLRIDEEDREK